MLVHEREVNSVLNLSQLCFLFPVCSFCPLTQIKMTNLFTSRCNFPKLSTERLRLLRQRPLRLIPLLQGHFFVLRWAGGLHWSASGPEGNKWFFLKEERSAGLLSAPDVFYFITEETQDWKPAEFSLQPWLLNFLYSAHFWGSLIYRDLWWVMMSLTGKCTSVL